MELVIFDWEGTLVKDIDLCFECLKETAAKLGWTLTSKLRLFTSPWHFFDSPVNGLTPFQSMQLRQAYQLAYRDITKPSSETIEVLDFLKKKRVKIAIATNLNRVEFDKEILQSKLDDYIDASVTPTEADSKPSPEMIKYLLEKLEVNPENSILVGDSATDIEAAIAARIQSVWLSPTDGLKPDPSHRIKTITELMDILKTS